jgi:ethanolamine utilization microcompartment shell protein EutL
MEPDHTQERQQAHALLDMLSAEKLNAVRGLLEVMVEPLSRSLALAPVEDEEITPETAAALDRARASLSQGEGIPHEDVLRGFGLGAQWPAAHLKR